MKPSFLPEKFLIETIYEKLWKTTDASRRAPFFPVPTFPYSMNQAGVAPCSRA
jgi:hypothetical protein